MSLLCNLGFHSWPKWSVHTKGEVTAASKSKPGHTRLIGETVVQVRTCSACGKVEYNTQHISYIGDGYV